MASVCIEIGHSFKFGNTRAIGCLQCLWGTLRTHQVMAEYCKLQFKNHPSMPSEHIKFIATNMGLESIQRLDTKVEAAEGSLKAMTKSVQEAVNSAKTTGNKLNNFMATVTKLEKPCQRWRRDD
jgi:septation ring formation regulator EzrA